MLIQFVFHFFQLCIIRHFFYRFEYDITVIARRMLEMLYELTYHNAGRAKGVGALRLLPNRLVRTHLFGTNRIS